MAKTKASVVSIPTLRASVNAVVVAYGSVQSANAAVLSAVVAASKKVKPDQQEVFIAMLREGLAPVLSESSLKVEVTRVRKVLAGLIAGAISAKDSTSLRGLYDLMKKPHAAQGATLAPKEDGTDADGKTAPKVKPASRADLIRELFGHFDQDLERAMVYAVANERIFVQWAMASAAAAQAKEIEKAAASLEQALAKPAKPAKAPAKRQRKTA